MPKKKKKKPVKKVKKKSVKRKLQKSARKKGVAKTKKSTSKAPKQKIKVIGVVTHFFPKVNAAVVKLKLPLSVGDTVVIKGSTTQLKQKVESMQIDHVAIGHAKKGDEIGLQVTDRVREHDLLIAP